VVRESAVRIRRLRQWIALDDINVPTDARERQGSSQTGQASPDHDSAWHEHDGKRLAGKLLSRRFVISGTPPCTLSPYRQKM
jgi:hypothetical protein